MSQEKKHGQEQEITCKDEVKKKTGGKSVWDWLDLISKLAIPLVVLGATIWFSWWQGQLAQQQHESDQQRALDQQQATILQTYIDNIQDLLIHNNLSGSKLGSEVAILARSRTLAALQALDPQRKGVLVQFLYEAHLIGYSDQVGQNIHPPIILLFDANLIGANLASAPLSGADLIETYLIRANLAGADLSGAALGDAHLPEANLRGTHLSEAQLNSADLKGADLSDADLSEANLESTYLSGADLSGADLSGADLFDVDLSGTNVTQRQLDQVSSCKGTILPIGLTCHQP